MAIEGVMKLFLMIAVIIVGMSFLMKAFGIDIFEWLQEKFGGFGVPESGKILHIRMDATGPKLYEFRLVSSQENNKHLSEYPVYFIFSQSALSQPKCIITITDEYSIVGGYSGDDEGYVLYVNPGTVIDTNCGNNLKACIRDKGFVYREGCRPGRTGDKPEECSTESICKLCNEGCSNDLGISCNCQINVNCGSEYSHVGCNKLGATEAVFCSVKDNTNSVPVERIDFQNDIRVVDCKGNKCNLLVKTDRDRWAYRVKFGLVCGGNGFWQVCTPKKADIAPPPGHSQVPGLTDCRCERDSGGEFFVWGGTCQPPSGGGGGE